MIAVLIICVLNVAICVHDGAEVDPSCVDDFPVDFLSAIAVVVARIPDFECIVQEVLGESSLAVERPMRSTSPVAIRGSS